jgi:mannose-1-phosphate guanylyltransferase/mannose-6-phosphate isomerase
MKRDAYAVIIAGGKGTRFWPLSTAERPKQLLKLLSAKSLLRETAERVAPLFGRRNIFVVTVEEHHRAIRSDIKTIPKANFLIEPEGKNTAPCIGLAALEIWAKDPRAVMVVLPSDHWIDGARRFARALGSAIELAARDDAVVTLGIRPSYPETGYGYILKARRTEGGSARMPVYGVRGFVEKPPRNKAAQFIRRGALWNSGIFIARAATLLEAIRRYAPAVARPLARIEAMTVGKSLGALPAKLRRALRREYRKMPNISIDYAVLEKAGAEGKVMTVEADFGWSDVGNWDALHRMLPKDRAGNAGPGRWVGFRSNNCLVYSPPHRLVALLGMQNAVVVDTPDALLVADMRRSQEVKDLLDELSRKGYGRYTAR